MAVPGGISPEAAAVQNYREFISLFNKMAEKCFNRCISDFNHSYLSEEEEKCIDQCSSKLVKVNHRLMAVFMEIGPPVDKQLGLSGSGAGMSI